MIQQTAQVVIGDRLQAATLSDDDPLHFAALGIAQNAAEFRGSLTPTQEKSTTEKNWLLFLNSRLYPDSNQDIADQRGCEENLERLVFFRDKAMFLMNI